ncbi:type I glyceraldehyde-3-phosphate dehydrogenase [Sulfurovum indicum]|uniref:Type I glyceraldehyde-3-phosphate dehydrogenase n=2 Tax=Sulfurovum TaxID=265570 RepID=A0A7M1S2A4_9BACT|nr:glyceraldehyde 3-phosphate dehydrogenase NAD-binding domain-containing protein [Sulfurovum indicum]QOR61161.1 type I glyceraldehyde-3-phosphate dehydrogenase [Sulfurovum indicum]
MNKKRIRVFINGFGRIGRSTARIILKESSFELVGINDLYSYEQMAYLLKYDSLYPALPYSIKTEGDVLFIDERKVQLFSESNPEKMDLGALDVDVVLQCSGMFLTVEANLPLIRNGAKRVLVSAPASDSMPTYIYGVNHETFEGEYIVSNSSCSANAIVPIFKIVDKYFGIQGAIMNMYHSYTSYQNLLDNSHYSMDIRRTRSATQNTIPLISSAAEATACFFPHLKGRMSAKSIRVPIPAATLYDLTVKLNGRYTKEEVNFRFEEEVRSIYADILDITNTPGGADNYIQNPYSAVINLPFTDVAGENLLRISAWQDNEYGYAKRVVDMAKIIGLFS